MGNLELKWSLITSTEEFEEALNLTKTHNLIVVDTETIKSDRYGEQDIIGVAWGFPEGTSFRAFYVPFRHGDFENQTKNLDPKLIARLQEFDSKDQIYHNALFDLTVFLRDGVDFTNTMIWDTMLMSHLVDESEFSFGLDDLSRKYYRDRKKDLKNVEKEIGWEKIPAYLMGEYASVDVFLTFKHYLRTLPILEYEDAISTYRDSLAYMLTLRRIVDRGLTVSPETAQRLSEAAQTRLQTLRQSLNLEPARASQVGLRLHGELGVPVRYKTKGKKPALDSSSLIKYSNEFEHARDFCDKVIEYRTLSKAVSTWYKGFFTKTDVQGLLHPGLNQVGTRTGRLSCREPNLQQVPRRGRARSLFVDSPGKILVEFDYSQIELRFASWYLKKVGDETFFNAYSNNEDVHLTTGERLGLIRSLGKKEGRQLGKTINFLLLYGGAGKKLQETIYKNSKGTTSYPLTQCNEWVNSYRETYPGVPFLNQDVSRKWQERHYITYWNGRRRHFNRLVDNPSAAFNSLIQGGCGQILMYSLIVLDKEMPDLQIVNTVHDSIWVYVKSEQEAEDIAPKVISIMKRLPEDKFELPFEVEWKYWRDTV